MKLYKFTFGSLRKKLKKRYNLLGYSTIKFRPLFWYTAKIMLYRRMQLTNAISSNSVENFIVGPCYGNVDFCNSKEDINLSWGSEDLYYTYQLLSKYLPLLPNIKNVILFYGVFSRGFDVEYTSFFPVSILTKLFFNIPYHNENIALELGFSDYEKFYSKYIYKLNSELHKMSPVYNEYKREKPVDTESAYAVALGHLENNRRENNQLIWLRKIINLINKQDKNLYIVFPPTKEEYYKHLPSTFELHKEVFDIESKNKNIKVLDYLVSKYFDENEDFEDYEHLNKKGAEKLTKLIKEKIRMDQISVAVEL